MDTALTPITGFAGAVAAQQASLLESAVRAAYEAGATRDTLLMAVDVARRRTEIPIPVAAQAYATVHRWAWIAAPPSPYRFDFRNPAFSASAWLPKHTLSFEVVAIRW